MFFYPLKKLFNVPQRILFSLQSYFHLKQHSIHIIFLIIANSKMQEKTQFMYTYHRTHLTSKKTTQQQQKPQAIFIRTILGF